MVTQPNNNKRDFAAWTEMIPESEIRKLLHYKARFYFGGPRRK